MRKLTTTFTKTYCDDETLWKQNIKSQSLPIIFANPEMHKAPPAFEFIVAAKNSSIKPLEETCKMTLTHYTHHFMNYCVTIVANMGQNRYVSVNDSHIVVSKLKKIDKINQILQETSVHCVSVTETLSNG